MVTYGATDLARRAISALLEHTDPVYEVIVVDNASPERTGQQLRAEIEGARIIFNNENLGFGQAANQGAQQARGRLVCHLNSDALPQRGWLPPLVEVLEDSTVGAVVPLFLNEDGTVQEAGSVVDSAGWPFALGAGEDPNQLELRFGRQIDFGSAACMMVRAADFAAVGGFDPVYGAGYYEDVDLCFRLEARGLRTMFEPRSRVVHVRFGSSDEEQARELTLQNRITFFGRWNKRLLGRPGLTDLLRRPHRVMAARDAQTPQRILVIDDRVPHFDRGSGDPRMAQLLTELGELWPRVRVTLFAADSTNVERYAEPLLACGIEVAHSGPDGDAWFEQRCFHYSIAIVSRPQNAEYFDGVLRRTQPQALRVFDIEALSSRRLELAAGFADDDAERAKLSSEASRMRSLEDRAIRSADALFCVSDDERLLIESAAPKTPAFVLPVYVEPDGLPVPFGDRQDLIFFGGFLAGPGSPNEDALQYLAAEVLPRIREELPGVVLRVVGADPTPAVRALHSEGIEIVGFVENPADYLRRARVHVNPVRYGAGIKIKLVETMAAGLPFVTTAVGAEGLCLGEFERDLIADDPAGLAQRTCSLYRDQARWEQAQDAVVEVARTHFDRSSFRRTLVAAMTSLGVAPPPRLGVAPPPASGQPAGGSGF